MRIARRVLTPLIIIGLAATTVVAQEPTPTMSVEAGFEGHCHQDSWCPVRIVLSNQSADFEGEIRVTSPLNTGFGAADIFVRSVLLPTLSRKAYFVYLPPPPSSHSPYYTSPSIGALQIDVELMDGRRTVASSTSTVRYLARDSRLYGIISSNPSALNYFSDVAPPGEQAFVAHLSPEMVAPDPLPWKGLDLLLLNDVDTTQFDAVQLQALETWIEQGGHLIVTGGTGGPQTASGVADLLPVTVERVGTVDSLVGLTDYLDAPVAQGPFPVAQASLREGRVIVEQDDLILFARRQIGSGIVDFVAFDAVVNPFTRWEYNIDLWMSITAADRTTPNRRSAALSSVYNAQLAVGEVPGIKPPSTTLIVAFLLTYTLLIGPVNYLILRKLDRRVLAWVTIPVLILGFTTCAYATGFLIRGRVVTVHRLALVRVSDQAEVGYATELVGLFSPRRTQYDVQARAAGARSLPQDTWGSTNAALTVLQESGVSTIDDLRVDVGALQPFLVEGFVEITPPQADLVLSEQDAGMWVGGTVRNGPLPLRDALLLTEGSSQWLGDIQAGQLFTTSVGLAGLGRASSSDVSLRILGNGSSLPEERYRRSQFLEALFPRGGPGLGPGIYLIGWSEQPVLDIQVLDRESRTHTTALYIFELSAAPPESGTTVFVSPSPTIDQEETTGYIDLEGNYVSLSPGTVAVINFTVWSEMMVSRVNRLTLELQAEYTNSPLPEVSLWDWEAEDWRAQTVDWGQNDIPAPEQYVSPAGTVRLRLEATGNEYIGLDRVSIMIEGQR